ncbi:hypothetical protein RN001_002685 [Aquatica leii]|uniref:Uncharacterized protein n=1 Tax=Aquatica leii TaxID=1421715 RepID=A0AAN7Q5K7_9COLE|nr:hypothetical protein RN001_011906 [Aquatica leii]KAK4886414.1 hypothetical protein RN001_002685 [Aquatica leii]
MKNWVGTRNVTFKLNEVESLVKEKIASVGAQEWSQVCRHVQEIEEGYIQKEHIIDTYCESLTFNVNDSSDEDSCGWSDEDDENQD